MSTKTTNFEFIKPEKTDPADITSTNENWDKVDVELVKRSHDLSMDGHRITDVAEPTNGSDVATRHFVEQHSIEGNTYVAVDYNKDGNITLKPYVADEDELTFKSHISNKNNPHEVTAEQVGLGVEDITDSFFKDNSLPIGIDQTEIYKQGNVISGYIGGILGDGSLGIGETMFHIAKGYRPRSDQTITGYLYKSDTELVDLRTLWTPSSNNTGEVETLTEISGIMMLLSFTYICE